MSTTTDNKDSALRQSFQAKYTGDGPDGQPLFIYGPEAARRRAADEQRRLKAIEDAKPAALVPDERGFVAKVGRWIRERARRNAA